MNRPENAPANTPDPDPALNVQFLDALVPQLTAGRYTLTAHQSLTKGDDHDDHVDEGYLPTPDAPVTQHIEVRAPRFTVQPEWIHGAYPPPGATGTYDDVLPHLTLERPTLPWERQEGTDSKGTPLPWLALLVFGENELPGDPHCLGHTEQRTAAQLSDPAARSTDDPADVVLPALDVHTDPITGDDEKQVCRTVLVPAAVFHAVAPAKDELPLLTHVRRVDRQHQGVTLTEDRIEPGDYAVAVANRLPSAVGGRYAAHLVSLEGWQSRLPDGSEEKEAYTGPAEKLRLVSLWSWTFESLADHAPGFAALTEHFVDTEGDQGSGLLLRVPVGDRPLSGPEQQEVADRLRAGYLPLSCRTESGRATFGWYRGPLVAEPVPRQTDRERRRCAAEALIHLEQYGVFDVSLATAFTAGRGVAFADHQFAAALLRLRGKVRKLAEEALSEPAHPVAGVAAGARARLAHLVTNGLGEHLHEIHRADQSSPRTVAATVTPVPAATQLPAIADISVRRLRADTGLRDRLSAALDTLTGDQPDEDLTAVHAWLTRLRSLEGVPFAHLVPDARMLPAESLRFFHVDGNWTATLVEGALSVGLAHSFDLAADDLLFGPHGKAPLPEPQGPVTGLLLRSQLVSGWPALEIRPYPNPRATNGENPLPVARRATLAEDVLLAVVDGIPGRVEIGEPQQGVHFGIDEPDDGGSDDPVDHGIIRLRSLTGRIGEELPDKQFPARSGLRPYLRATGGGPDRVLRTAKLADGLQGALELQQPLTPGQFALQMINAAQRRTFTTTPTTGDHSHG
ncbi:hypothetical protein I5Q34_26160 [Streptomyces sp. AV19]|uniref:hypothetical protein n=1 Tax=Streptomyces sp. AV19 TaxID=2793068 RepID=UPI0018FE4C85|nr:hypothetical protein [Streptomyces sp. AV19]MBH1937714.1 hypothetical protein [Streptomyces sp. AV19]MDG4536382.1 hypothetical protein [Streptomyces sp. AV19]